MRIAFLLLSLATFLFFFNSCQVCSCKKVPCPAFSDAEFSSWFPYSADQQIFFRNNSVTDTFTADYVDQSPAYDANKGCYNGSQGCVSTYHIYSKERYANFSPKLVISCFSLTPFTSPGTTQQVTLNLFNFRCTAWGINDQGLKLDTGIYSGQHFNSLNIGGNVYSNVNLIIKDTTNSSNKTHGPYKVYLAKNQGLVAYENYPALDMWIKQ